MRSLSSKTSLRFVLCLPLALTACGTDSAADGDGEGETGSEASGTSSEAGDDTTGSEGEAGSETTGGDGDGDGDGDDSTTGPVSCAPTPARMVVLGDSVAAGVGTNGPEGDMNGFKMMHAYVESVYADGTLTFENYSVGGAKTTDVPDKQLDDIPIGMPGHVLVNIHVGGNDLSPFIIDSDENALAQFDGLVAEALADWATIWAFFDNPANFPDGATLVVNTQYNPFDDCDASYNGVSLSDTKSMLLREYNSIMRDEVAMHANAIVADQHPVFLGHGHNHDKSQCASYLGDGTEYWMVGGFDFIHANQLGHAAMAEVFRNNADDLYLNCE